MTSMKTAYTAGSKASASKHALIFGGTGYIGRTFAKYATANRLFDKVTLLDIEKPPRFLACNQIDYQHCDIRLPIQAQIGDLKADWIFNFAAVHREPGHEPAEYFETNVTGAENVAFYAEQANINNIVFSSSIAVYGECRSAVNEDFLCKPDTAYGSSKLVAEYIHKGWASKTSDRRLIIVRPGVVYGPGELGNMLRLVHALQLGIFMFPGNSQVRKSYAYIFGLLESLSFAMQQSDSLFLYNYVEKETAPLGEIVSAIQEVLGKEGRKPFRLPATALQLGAHGLQIISGGRSPIHPSRVSKVAKATHILPSTLIKRDFNFPFNFKTSLEHWKLTAPQDFLSGGTDIIRAMQMKAGSLAFSFLDKSR